MSCSEKPFGKIFYINACISRIIPCTNKTVMLPRNLNTYSNLS